MKAFPISEANLIHVNSESCAGMDLRDYFAAKAMQGFLSTLREVTNGSPPKWNVLAGDAYTMADAMMEARK